MSLWFYCVAPVIGFIGMMSGGYWGVGCGWLVVPAMLILGFNPLEAVGIGLLQMVPSTLLTVCRQAPEIGWKAGMPGRSLALPIACGALLTSFCGKTINQKLLTMAGECPLQWLLIGVIAFIGAQTLLSRTRCYNDQMPPIPLRKSVIAFATGVATGLLSSLLGIGGGLLTRPLLTSGFQVPEYYTSRIVRLLVLVTTTAGGATYLFTSGTIDSKILLVSLLVAAGGIFGFPLGAKMHRIVYDAGYAQSIHKSFAAIAGAMLIGTFCNLMEMRELSRAIMIAIAPLMVGMLTWFTLYARRHPRPHDAC